MSVSTCPPPHPGFGPAIGPATAGSDRGEAAGPRRILLIDDEPDICLLVQAALTEFQGWQVITCSHPGSWALDDHVPWDAILLEVSIARLAGFSLVPALRANPATRSIPIVLLTSQLRPQDFARFGQMDVDGVIAKPFDPLTLGHHIAVLLGWQGAIAPLSPCCQPAEG